MPPPHRWNWRHLLRARLGDELSVANRVVDHGELQHSVEDEPAARRAPPVKTEAELVQITREMRVVEAPLMGAREPPFGE